MGFQTEILKSIVAREDFPHLLVYGPSGAGKKTRINCILKSEFLFSKKYYIFLI